MKKDARVKIIATREELESLMINDLSIEAILQNREGIIHHNGSKDSEVRTALGIWFIHNNLLEVI